MKIVAITGTGVKGCTWHIKEAFLDPCRTREHSIVEFTLPNDFPHFCLGCKTCFNETEEKCPHHQALNPILEAILESDLLVFAYPVYVMRAPGQVKALLDHLGFQWFVHRPNPLMFKKRAVILTNSIGAPNGAAQKDVKTSLNWMGVSDIKRYSFPLMEGVVWDELSEKRRNKILLGCKKAAEEQLQKSGTPSMNLKVKMIFTLNKMLQKNLYKKGLDTADLRHWKKQGWL